ncbi:MAG: hypothetical protein EKK71_03595 [Candidatus Competibacteraceae bacterium]|nr:MAG: hypothetical protein EKK71_03595 [Candidatus Competibacteraceae bacterium]
MVQSGVSGIHWRSIGWVALSALGGAVATMLVLLLFYRVGGLTAVAPPVVLTATDLHPVETPAGASPSTAVRGVVERMVRADLFQRLSWRVQGLTPDSELRLSWVTLAEPRTVQERLLPAHDEGTVDLSAEPHWQGRIIAVGLSVSGAVAEPLAFQRLELQSHMLSPGESLRWAVDEWNGFDDWSRRSINYAAGIPLDALFPPVVVVALWVGFSVALHALCAPKRRWMPYAALFLLGWLALDLRWQLVLNQRLALSMERFAGKDETARRLADQDGKLYQFLVEVRQRLPDRPARLLIVSNDPAGFTAGRTRYHLLPHNGYAGLSQPPEPAMVRAGDYVLILSPLKGVRYNRAAQALEWDNKQLAANLLYAASTGALFQVRAQ